ncbi:MAG: ROK family transcriptional regulator [Pseudomonadota bacterium]
MERESGLEHGPRAVGNAGLDARAATRLRVLNCIRDAGEASRTEIAAALRLSPATVTFVTSGLMAGGLIEEVAGQDAPDTAKRGRPRVALRLTSGRNYVAGIKVARKAISVLVLDFGGSEVAKAEFPLAQSQMEPETMVATLRDCVAEVCRDLPGGLAALAGISIGLPGQIDAGARFVHWSSSLTQGNVDLGALLVQHLPCAAFVENDANLVAKAEHLFGEARGLCNFLVVTVEHGVGLGIVLDGKLYRGERGCGAEFGHTKVELNGAPCQCGQSGCLEAYVGTFALLREAKDILGPGETPTVRALVEAATHGNPRAQAVLDRAGQVFGMGLANLINLFDPERIILAGAQHRIAHLHSDAVMEQVRRSAVNVDVPLPDIRVHHWGDEMWARGAAALGIEKVSELKVKELGRDAA